MSLKVKCDNTANGCQWIGELRSLEKHLTNCDFALLPCPNQCKDGDKIHKLMRKDIENHKKEECPRRQYECPHCQENGEYQERTTTHLEECPKMKIPCPNDGCDEKIWRCNISQHRKKCLFEIVLCKFTNINCTRKVFRKDLIEHQNDSQQHLQLAIEKVNQQQVTIKTLQEKMAQQEVSIEKLQEKMAQQQITIKKLQEKMVQQQPTPMKFRVTNFKQLKSSGKTFYSTAFYTSPEGYKMCIRFCANGEGDTKGTHISVYGYLMRGENDDHLPWPFTGTVTIKLLNQLKDNIHYSRQVKFPPDNKASQRVVNEECSSSGYGYIAFIPHSALGYDAATGCQYLKDDCLYFRVKVDTKTSIKPWLVL